MSTMRNHRYQRKDKFFLFIFLPSRSAKESERVQPVTVPDLDLGSGEFGGNWYARDLAYGADSLIENLAGEMGGGTGWLDGWMGRLIYWGGGVLYTAVARLVIVLFTGPRCFCRCSHPGAAYLRHFRFG